MKVRPTGLALSLSKRIDNAVVIVDDYHRSRLGLEIVGTDCAIVSTPEEGSDIDIEHRTRIAVIDSRPEVFVQTLEWFIREAWAELSDVVLVMPSHDFFSVHDAVSNSTVGSLLSIAGLAFEGELASVQLSPCAEADVHSSVLVAGLLLGIESAHAVPWQSTETPPEVQQLQQKILSLLEIQDLITTERASEPSQFAITESASGSPESPNRLKELEEQLVTATTHLDSLQRKYDALASSRLGQITLKHWDRNRRRSK